MVKELLWVSTRCLCPLAGIPNGTSITACMQSKGQVHDQNTNTSTGGFQVFEFMTGWEGIKANSSITGRTASRGRNYCESPTHPPVSACPPHEVRMPVIIGHRGTAGSDRNQGLSQQCPLASASSQQAPTVGQEAEAESQSGSDRQPQTWSRGESYLPGHQKPLL